MKIITLIVILTLATPAISQNKDVTPHIEIAADAEIEFDADLGMFEYTVREKGSSLKDAVKKALDKVSRINKDLVALGLKEDEIATQKFSSQRNMYDSSFWSKKSDFEADIRVKIRTENINVIDDCILALSGERVKQISSVSFALKDIHSKKMQSYELALKRAKQKMELIAKTMNSKFGKVLYFTDTFGRLSNAGYMNTLNVRGGRSRETASVINSVVNNAITPQKFKLTSTVRLRIEVIE